MAGRHSRSASEIVNGVLGFVARLSAVAFILGMAYLAFVAFSGALRDYPQGFTAETSNLATRNVGFASDVVVSSSIIFAIAMAMLYYGVPWLPLAYLVAGALLFFLFPHFGAPHISEAAKSMARRNHPGHDLLQAWSVAGGAFLVGGIVMLAGVALEHLRDSLNAPRRAGGALRVPFYSPCWQTQYCKDEISKLCAPGRGNYRKSCWRHKSGCFCDESISDKVLATARRQAGKEADKWFGKPAPAPSPSFSDRFRSTHHRVPGQRIACADCPIYNFHQLQKHRILAPILLLSVPAVVFLKYDVLHRLYGQAVAHLERFTMHLAFTPESSAVVSGQLRNALAVQGMEVLLIIVFTLILMTSVVRALEFWCFTAKL